MRIMSIKRLLAMLALGNLPIFPTVLAVSFLLITNSASAAVFGVTESAWGTPAQTGSFAWAIDQANKTPGTDTINVQGGLEISVDSVDPATLTEVWASF
jgi:hypothetical protein